VGPPWKWVLDEGCPKECVFVAPCRLVVGKGVSKECVLVGPPWRLVVRRRRDVQKKVCSAAVEIGSGDELFLLLQWCCARSDGRCASEDVEENV
jgi:hypothetical protein